MPTPELPAAFKMHLANLMTKDIDSSFGNLFGQLVKTPNFGQLIELASMRSHIGLITKEMSEQIAVASKTSRFFAATFDAIKLPDPTLLSRFANQAQQFQEISVALHKAINLDCIARMQIPIQSLALQLPDVSQLATLRSFSRIIAQTDWKSLQAELDQIEQDEREALLLEQQLAEITAAIGSMEPEGIVPYLIDLWNEKKKIPVVTFLIICIKANGTKIAWNASVATVGFIGWLFLGEKGERQPTIKEVRSTIVVEMQMPDEITSTFRIVSANDTAVFDRSCRNRKKIGTLQRGDRVVILNSQGKWRMIQAVIDKKPIECWGRAKYLVKVKINR